jgi:asparagine synthase (glutamine-hydrolysing)
MFACIMARATRDAPQSYATSQTLLDALTPYNQDDVQGQWSDDHMLMVQALTWNTPESRHESAPEVCKDTGRVIVSWVRLDNRKALCTQLRLADVKTLTDPQIILESHRKWGADCADQLEGDFSFVIYDPARAQAFCARDSIGAKPFFYYADAKVFIAASTAAIFRRLKKLSITPSQEWIARQLTSIPHVVTKSAYDDVMRLAPAHSLTVAREGAIESLEYFRFKDMAPAADTRDPAYVDAYREAFHNAVEVRLRSDFLIGAENSGGLDSVSIMGHAVKHLPHDIEDFHCFGLPKMERDQELIVDASVHAKVHHTHLSTRMTVFGEHVNFERAVKALGYPVEHSQINMHMPALRQSEALGIRTMLSGYGGDEIVTNQAATLNRELFNNKQFKALRAEVSGKPLIKQLRFLRLVRRLRRQNDTYSRLHLGILERGLEMSPVKREVVENLNIVADQTALINHAANAKTLNERILRDRSFSCIRVGRLESCSILGQSHRVEYSWPMYDRPLIQQYLKTPALEKRHLAMGRYLHRRAVKGSIPDAITWQRTKDMGKVVDEAFSNRLPDMLDRASMSQYLSPLLDFEKLQKMHANVKTGQAATEKTDNRVFHRVSLSSLLAVACWLDTY